MRLAREVLPPEVYATLTRGKSRAATETRPQVHQAAPPTLTSSSPSRDRPRAGRPASTTFCAAPSNGVAGARHQFVMTDIEAAVFDRAVIDAPQLADLARPNLE